jgi:hypothetical protein
MKFLVENSFHNTKSSISIKQEWVALAEKWALDIGTLIVAYPENPYLVKKSKELKRKTCGSKGCRCAGFTKLTQITQGV